MVGATPSAALAAIPTRGGTSRCVKVIVPRFPEGMSGWLGAFVAFAFVAAVTYPPGPSEHAAAVAPAPARNLRRLILASASSRFSVLRLRLMGSPLIPGRGRPAALRAPGSVVDDYGVPT